ncbi:MAG: hypothetical protein M3135_02055 [Actinomycetota bacterium]|nr:hypothetical protein [Actinomycetota bacterium]
MFLSYPKPCRSQQQRFVDEICSYLDSRGFAPRTLGVTDYDLDAPLKAIRRLMLESNGLITIAFRRTYIEKGVGNHRTDIESLKEVPLLDTWLTSPWAHIEPTMAYQIGLPILVLREKGVLDDGVLQKGVTGIYMPEFDCEVPVDEYFMSPEWNDLIWKWEGHVRAVVDTKGNPPKLY